MNSTKRLIRILVRQAWDVVEEAYATIHIYFSAAERDERVRDRLTRITSPKTIDKIIAKGSPTKKALLFMNNPNLDSEQRLILLFWTYEMEDIADYYEPGISLTGQSIRNAFAYNLAPNIQISVLAVLARNEDNIYTLDKVRLYGGAGLPEEIQIILSLKLDGASDV